MGSGKNSAHLSGRGSWWTLGSGRSERRDVHRSERDDEERVAVLHSNVHEACALDLVRRAVSRVDE